MTSPATNRFSAPGPMLGYLVQVEYALLIALQRMDSDIDLRLSIETTDDITFEAEGVPRELWQTKHHVNKQGSLGDASVDIWKTLYNWIETSDTTTACFLLSTVTAPVGSAAACLRAGRSEQDLLAARTALDTVARGEGNTGSAAYYVRYRSLTDEERLELLRRVTVLDGAVSAAAITEQLVVSVRKAATAERRLALVERLRGWWHSRTMAHLELIAAHKSDWIALGEIEHHLLAIAQTLRADNLPLDFDDTTEPTSAEVEQDDRIFVEQLKLILLHHERIRHAVYDHNRAFLQRSRWQREQLLGVGELAKYDQRLIEEWKRIFTPLEEPTGDGDTTAEQQCSAARQLYQRLQERALPEIRTELRSGYIPFGSLHIIADRLDIGWHPAWIELLKHRLPEVQFVDHAQGAA